MCSGKTTIKWFLYPKCFCFVCVCVFNVSHKKDFNSNQIKALGERVVLILSFRE